MQTDRPRPKALRAVARAHHLDLDDEVIEAVSAAFDGFPALADGWADGAPVPEDRSWSLSQRRPRAEDDPYNAIVRRCDRVHRDRGPLAGLRVVVKDSIALAGLPLTCGSHLLDGFVADFDAAVVARLLDAGARVVAHANMDAMAVAATGDTSTFGRVHNPHEPSLLAGGSSGGSAAALFYDDVDAALGTDQGGSIRIPAAWCGVVGHKPTFGLVPYTGIVGLEASIDHVGPLARSVCDVARVLEIIAGRDPEDPRQPAILGAGRFHQELERGARGLRVGLLEEGFDPPGADPALIACVRDAGRLFAALGAHVSAVSVPVHRTAAGQMLPIQCEGFASLLEGRGVHPRSGSGGDRRLARVLAGAARSRARTLPPLAQTLLLLGYGLGQRGRSGPYARAQDARHELRAAYDRALRTVDLLLMPTTPTTAPRRLVAGGSFAHHVSTNLSATANTAPFDLTGHPALSLPCGSIDGRPVGLMLVGRHFEDATVLRAARAFERATALEAAGIDGGHSATRLNGRR